MSKLRAVMLLMAIILGGAMSAMFYLRYTSRELALRVPDLEILSESSLDNVRLVQHEAGKLKWVLNSRKADVFDGESYVDLEGVDLVIITGEEGRLRVIGDTGKYARDSSDFWVSGNVRVISGKDYTLYADAVHWEIDRQTIKTDGPARAEGPSGFITGKGMVIDVQNQNVYFAENVNAQLN